MNVFNPGYITRMVACSPRIYVSSDMMDSLVSFMLVLVGDMIKHFDPHDKG